jgi:hypothetical protein
MFFFSCKQSILSNVNVLSTRDAWTICVVALTKKDSRLWERVY